MIAQHGAEAGAPDSRRFCANWGGKAECWVQWQNALESLGDDSVS